MWRKRLAYNQSLTNCTLHAPKVIDGGHYPHTVAHKTADGVVDRGRVCSYRSCTVTEHARLLTTGVRYQVNQ